MRERLEVTLTKDSSGAGLFDKAAPRVEVSKDDAGVRGVHDWLVQQFDAGRVAAVEWKEVAGMVRERLENSLLQKSRS